MDIEKYYNRDQEYKDIKADYFNYFAAYSSMFPNAEMAFDILEKEKSNILTPQQHIKNFNQVVDEFPKDILESMQQWHDDLMNIKSVEDMEVFRKKYPAGYDPR